MGAGSTHPCGRDARMARQIHQPEDRFIRFRRPASRRCPPSRSPMGQPVRAHSGQRSTTAATCTPAGWNRPRRPTGTRTGGSAATATTWTTSPRRCSSAASPVTKSRAWRSSNGTSAGWNGHTRPSRRCSSRPRPRSCYAGWVTRVWAGLLCDGTPRRDPAVGVDGHRGVRGDGPARPSYRREIRRM